MWMAIVVSACGSSPSTSPTESPRVNGTPQRALSGLVRAGGNPLAGARVALVRFQLDALAATVMTDVDGAYRFSSADPVSVSGALVSVSKPDFFTATRYVPMFQDQVQDFDLERAVYIAVGDVVRSPVGDARCASLGYGGGAGAMCRRFALTMADSGTLEISVSANGLPLDVSVLRADGTIGAYVAAPVSPALVSLRVAAGLTYQIDVVHIDPATREFDLTTTLR